MGISQGEKLPDGTWMRIGDAGPETVSIKDMTLGRKIVIFAVPGAFTPTCHSAHMPSFVSQMEEFKAKGVQEVICLAVNDPFVMEAWGQASGAAEAGITMMADPEAGFTKALGLDFSAPPAGLIARSKRYAMLVDDGLVTKLSVEEAPGQCALSRGDVFLAEL